MFYSKKTSGFYSSEQYGAPTPVDSVYIEDDYYHQLLIGQSAGMIICAGEDGYPVLKSPDPYIAPVPSSVTMRQARLALHAAGLLDQVELAIDALPEPPRTAARIEWDYSSEVHRDSEFVAMMGQALGLEDQALDDLFVKASAL